ncbi:putative HTH-type transcriptional regulator YdjF [Paenibacillus solanacearum]|uniref:HTH-type transcriptional regulator YdjF n=1 Tax=Paenibacillus solanacearum TaxID=2048548 RepID=A0A916JS47_9BACL|nr:DeoR/GlpR family DNA-binding transcription regulator [Paenibacillus solanacearum]CAG7597958.1 putative HTH-type transcriptional regulator YdjF [Paenibacillus solanacearum]
MAVDRKKEIIQILEHSGTVRVGDLSERFGVTEETIRRDLDRLESEGLIVRTHGGAVLSQRDKGFEPPVLLRESMRLKQKQAIGKCAASLVEEGEIIALDASTTCLQIAKHLPDMPLTVLTYSLAVANELITRHNISLILTGGNLDGDSMAITGMSAEAMVEGYHVDKFFFSCQGFDHQRGVSEPYETHARLKKKIMNISDQLILAADSSKFRRKSLIRLIGLEDVHMLITDKELLEEESVVLENKDFEVVYAD